MSHNNLFQLVHSLSKAEKKHFKLSIPFKKQKDLPKYVRLFTLLEKQKVYDEAALKRHKFNAMDRQYLMDKLLESLVAFNKQKSIEAQLYQLLAQLPILYQKQLWALLKKQLQQGKKLALTYELHWFYTKLLEWELLIHMHDQRKMEQLDLLSEQQLSYVQDLSKTYAYIYLKRQIALLQNQNLQGVAQQSKVKSLLAASDLLNNESSLNSLTHQIHFHQLKSRQAILEKQPLVAYEHIQQCKVLFEENTDIQSIHETWYQGVLCMHLEVQLKAEQLDLFPVVLQQLQCCSNHSRVTSDLMCNKINFKGLLYFLRVGDFDNCFLLIEDLEENWSTYDPLLKPSRKVSYYYNIALVYLFNESWQTAYEWLDKIIALRLPTIREDVQHGIRILFLLLTYELDQSELDKAFDNAYRYFKRHKRYGAFEREVIGYFKQLYKVFDRREEKAVFVTFLAMLQSLEMKILSSTELLLWCQSKVEDRSLLEVYLDAVGEKE